MNAILAALGGTGALAGLVAALVMLIKAKVRDIEANTEAKKAAADRRTKTKEEHDAQAAVLAEMRCMLDLLTTSSRETEAELREKIEELKKKNLALESKNDKLTTALSLAAGPKEK